MEPKFEFSKDFIDEGMAFYLVKLKDLNAL